MYNTCGPAGWRDAKDAHLFSIQERKSICKPCQTTSGMTVCQFCILFYKRQPSGKPKAKVHVLKWRIKQKEPFGSAFFQSPTFLILVVPIGSRMGEQRQILKQHDLMMTTQMIQPKKVQPFPNMQMAPGTQRTRDMKYRLLVGSRQGEETNSQDLSHLGLKKKRAS